MEREHPGRGGQARAAEAMGVHRVHLGEYLRGTRHARGQGMASGIAKVLGISVDEVYGKPTRKPRALVGSAPVLRNLRGIDDALAEAMRREPFVPPDLWNEALNANALALTVATPELVIAMMKLAHATRTAPSDAAEEARVDSEETDREARQVEGERRVREAAARGEKLSLSKAMAQIRREQGSEED